MTTIQTILMQAARDLAKSGSPSPRLDAEVLLMHVLKSDRVRLYLYPERALTVEEAAGFAGVIERRRRGEPVAYILGEKEFWSLSFVVNREVLIPRPETECLIEEVLRCCKPKSRDLTIIDIGTGSGVIGIVLAMEFPLARVVATDISPGALAVARRNADRHGVAGRMDFRHGNLFTAPSGSFDIIVSNPPYIPDGVYSDLPAGIREFEPRGALVAGPDGAAFHREIIREGCGRLKPGGRIFLEIGEGQGDLVGSLYRDAGEYDEIRICKDYGEMDRIATAKRKN